VDLEGQVPATVPNGLARRQPVDCNLSAVVPENDRTRDVVAGHLITGHLDPVHQERELGCVVDLTRADASLPRTSQHSKSVVEVMTSISADIAIVLRGQPMQAAVDHPKPRTGPKNHSAHRSHQYKDGQGRHDRRDSPTHRRHMQPTQMAQPGEHSPHHSFRASPALGMDAPTRT